MKIFNTFPLVAALALSALPVMSPAGEAPAASAAAQREQEKAALENEKKLADAQQRLEAASREVAELSRQMGRRFNFQVGTGPNGPPPRALLGVSIGPGPDKDGAHVMEVSPGGPAAEAGIRTGDVITGFADMDLTKDSNPGRALVEKMNQLEPDQKVKVAVLREGKKLNFDVTTRRAPPQNLGRVVQSLVGAARGPGNPGEPGTRQFNLQNPPRNGPDGPQGPENNQFRRGGQQPDVQRLTERLQALPQLLQGGDSEARFDGAEFASLSERLGGYFGVKTGVLVVRAGVNSWLKLQDGDVILAIDGREATTAQQAGRILRSYQPGEKLTVRVQRDRKAQNIDATAPGNGRRN